jgi:predicted nucleotidyltransferase
MHLKPRPDKPLDPISSRVIRAVTSVADELGIGSFMVGATARIILLEHVFGLPPSRATRDIDFAFAVESWEQFQALKQRLVSEASFTPLERVAQRLKFKSEGMNHSLVAPIATITKPAKTRVSCARRNESGVFKSVAVPNGPSIPPRISCPVHRFGE